MNMTRTFAALPLQLVLAALAFSTPATAADDHGHDHDAPAATGGPALPRFAAVSDAFELVGVVSGRQLTVYLDRFEDNAPVKDAKVELEIGSEKVALAQRADGEYEGTLAREPGPGVVAVTASIVAGGDADIVAGELDVHEASVAHAADARGWRRYAAWGGGAIAVLAVAAWLTRRARAGAAA